MSVSDTPRNFNKLAKVQERKIRAAFLQAIRDISALVGVGALSTAISEQNVPAAIEAAGISKQLFGPLDAGITGTFTAGGGYSLAALPARNPATGQRLIIRFQGRHPRAEAWVSREAGNLIQDIVEGQRTTIASVIRRGLADGRNPRAISLDIAGRMNRGARVRTGGLIGLTEQEADAVFNMRRELSSISKRKGKYFSRAARDRRFDEMIERARRLRKPLTQAQINRITGRYADRLLKARGDRIARTEVIKALNAGRVEGMLQLVDTGEVEKKDITKVWDASGDDRVRSSHELMEGQAVEVDQPFLSPRGARLMHPGDTSLGASGAETIQCRCWMRQKIDWLAGAI